tara:strand:+ start:244 stop:852 length:609 start_codon:yes stop_codon:yes gene_type:complete
MTYEAKITLKFDSKWEYTGGIYDEEMLPEEHITMAVPAQDLNTTQLFTLFTNFARAIGHTEVSIAKGACSVAFNDMRSQEDMRKVAEEYDLKLSEDYRDEVCKLEAEVRDLKAKLSRLEQPDNPQYTDEEMEAMSHEVADALVNKLQGAYTICSDCGSKYGEYSVGCSSVWEGKCDVCDEVKLVTETRDYGYLNKGIKVLLK